MTKTNLTALNKRHPQIYVFEDRHEPGWIKVDYTEKQNSSDSY